MYIVPQKNPTTKYEEVRQVQLWLNSIRSCNDSYNWNTLKVDGYLGEITGYAIERFQRIHNLRPPQYGVLGDCTYDCIRKKQIEYNSKMFGSISATPNYSLAHQIKTSIRIKLSPIIEQDLNDKFISFLQSAFDESARFMGTKIAVTNLKNGLRDFDGLQIGFRQLAKKMNEDKWTKIIQEKTQKPKEEIKRIVQKLSNGEKQKISRSVKKAISDTQKITPNNLTNKVSKAIVKGSGGIAKVGGKAMKWLSVGQAILKLINAILIGEIEKIKEALFEIVDQLILVAVGVLIGIVVGALGITIGWVVVLVSAIIAIIVSVIYDWLKELCGDMPVSMSLYNSIDSWIQSRDFQLLLAKE